MPIDPVTGGLIVAGAAALGQGANAYAQGKMNRKTRKWNERMHNQQRREALEDYQMQNDYNHPSSQMARLREAGLNPNLVYGNGATTEASGIRPAPVESWNPRPAQFDIGGAAASGLAAYQDITLRQAQVDNLRVQNTVLEQEKLLKTAQIANTAAQTGKTSADTAETLFNTELKKALRENTIQGAIAGVEATRASTKSTLDENDRRAAMHKPNLLAAAEAILKSRQDRAKSQAEIRHINQQIENLKKDERIKELDIELKEKGIQPGDPLYLRALGQLVSTDDVKEFGSNLYKAFTRPAGAPLQDLPDSIKKRIRRK